MKILVVAVFTFISILLPLNSSYAADLQVVPNWQLKTQNGKNISLEELKGKPVILHFWATWCPYCKKLQPKLVEMQNKYEQEGVVIVGISFNEDEGARPQDEITARGYTFTTAVNGGKVAELYGVRGTPTTFYLNKKRELIYRSSNSDINDPKIELALQQMIK
jgi:cytochrome c biogenesis protein CcmG, thiol:disulfide interchange protein DsbE